MGRVRSEADSLADAFDWRPEENPAPLPHIRCRLIGPETVNGMSTWRVIRYDRANGRVEPVQVGDRCMTYKEAMQRIKDVLMDRRVIYVGPHRFEPKAL